MLEIKKKKTLPNWHVHYLDSPDDALRKIFYVLSAHQHLSWFLKNDVNITHAFWCYVSRIIEVTLYLLSIKSANIFHATPVFERLLRELLFEPSGPYHQPAQLVDVVLVPELVRALDVSSDKHGQKEIHRPILTTKFRLQIWFTLMTKMMIFVLSPSALYLDTASIHLTTHSITATTP